MRPADTTHPEGEGTVDTSEAARPVVVGVDGSAHSYWAIERALEEAARRDVGVKLVHAVDQGFVVITPVPGDGSEQVRLSAQSVLNKAVAVADGRGVPVASVLAYGPPEAVLVAASEAATMLVVGSRGRSTCRGSSRSSVPSACLRRASCPVLIVPAPGHCEAPVGASTG